MNAASRDCTFCVYYSIMDWHHPAQYRGSDSNYNPTKVHPDKKREYVDYMKAQLKELVTKYGVAVLWFDGEWPDWWTEEEAPRDLCVPPRTQARHHRQQPCRQGS